MYDLAKHTHSLTPTWHSSRYSSRIDYIWANHTIIRYLTSYHTDDANQSTLSDHNILISAWEFPYAITGKRRSATKSKRRIFAYKQMNQDLWQNFADQVTSNLQSQNTPFTTNTTESLEATWHKIQTSIITAALQHIPNKKFTVRNFQHIFSSKASKLHLCLKKLGNIIRQVKASTRNHTSVPIFYNQDID